jgi:hypothetical protein
MMGLPLLGMLFHSRVTYFVRLSSRPRDMTYVCRTMSVRCRGRWYEPVGMGADAMAVQRTVDSSVCHIS